MMFEQSDDEKRQGLEALIRVGEVTSVDPAKLTARVTFDDDDGMTSFDLPILQRNTLKNHDHACVDVGEDVLCLFLPSGVEEGFVVGSFYAGEIVPEQSSQDVREVKFEDGTVLRYDRAAHKLEGDIKGDVSIKLSGKAEVTAQGAVSVTSSAKITLTAPAIELNGAITTNSQSGGSGTMKVNGQMEISGNITGKSDITASGVSLKSHVHTCPDGTTSGPY